MRRHWMKTGAAPLAAIGAAVVAFTSPASPATRAAATAGTASGAAAPRPASLLQPGLHHYEYVFPDRAMFVYDIDHAHRLVAQTSLPDVNGIRGVVASPARSRLYISYGSDAGGPGDLLAYDLVADRILWRRAYLFGVDSMAISPDGRRIYMPGGEASAGTTWHILDAQSGAVTGVLNGGRGPHNTVVSLDGSRIYLGGRNSRYLFVASAATGRTIGRIGPLVSGVRPFTIDGRQRFAFTTATAFLGFQVSSIRTGRVLFTQGVPGFHWNPATFALSTPSHGISLSPNERELWLLDAANGYVHVFDVRGLPRHRPRKVADIALDPPISGNDSPCSFDLCARFGWLQHSADGRFVYVGDSGDVIDTATRRVIAVLPALHNTRKSIEIDWKAGVPVATTSRIGVGHVTR